MKLIVPSIALVAAMTMPAQHAHNSAQLRVNNSADTPAYKITGNVERGTKAINYGKRTGLTNVDVQGTALLAEARGEAKVTGAQGHMEVQAEFGGLPDATRFGPEYLTYVLWAIAPNGYATNLGEIVPNDTRVKINATIDFDVFGLIVTAEPYFAVSQPNDVVVMQNVLNMDAVSKIEQVEAKYPLLPRGTYTANVSRSNVKPIVVDPDTPLD